jgi:hypothetical protein
MKKVLLFILIAASISCKKEYDSIYSFPETDGKALVKFVHAVPNIFTTSQSTQSGINIYLNDVKTSSLVTYGGGIFPGLEYVLTPSGNLTLKAVAPATATTPEVPVLTAPLALSAGKTYTVFVADTLPNTSLLRIEEDFSAKADSGKYFVRFVNLLAKTTTLDLYGVTDVAMTIPNVAYKTASGFVQVNVGSGARTFAVRKPSTTTNIATVNITPVAGRMYTIFSYGVDGGVTANGRNPRATFFTSRYQQ